MSDIGTFFIGHLSVGVNKVAYEEAIPVKYHSGAESHEVENSMYEYKFVDSLLIHETNFDH